MKGPLKQFFPWHVHCIFIDTALQKNSAICFFMNREVIDILLKNWRTRSETDRICSADFRLGWKTNRSGIVDLVHVFIPLDPLIWMKSVIQVSMATREHDFNSERISVRVECLFIGDNHHRLCCHFAPSTAHHIEPVIIPCLTRPWLCWKKRRISTRWFLNLPAAFPASCAFLPTLETVCLVNYSERYYRMPDMLLPETPLSIVRIIVMTVAMSSSFRHSLLGKRWLRYRCTRFNGTEFDWSV